MAGINQVMENNQSSGEIIKPRKGGARAGAGRRGIGWRLRNDPRWLAEHGVNTMSAAMILAYVTDEARTWKRILTSDDDRVVLQAMMFLTSMRDGKPAQQINVTSTTITLRPEDIERARAIVREIRGELGPAPHEIGDDATITQPLLTSPLQVDDPTGASIAATTERRKGEPMLLGDEGGNKGGMGVVVEVE